MQLETWLTDEFFGDLAEELDLDLEVAVDDREKVQGRQGLVVWLESGCHSTALWVRPVASGGNTGVLLGALLDARTRIKTVWRASGYPNRTGIIEIAPRNAPPETRFSRRIKIALKEKVRLWGRVRPRMVRDEKRGAIRLTDGMFLWVCTMERGTPLVLGTRERELIRTAWFLCGMPTEIDEAIFEGATGGARGSSRNTKAEENIAT